jgi:phosphate transport system protein
MQTHHEQELTELKDKLLLMGSHAESAVSRAVQAVVTRDDTLACQVRADDSILDQFEVALDEMVVALLSRAPLAGDLRLVLMVMKISQNLERVGDEANKIAKRARDLAGEPPLKVGVDIPTMARLAVELLKESLDAFVRRDAAAAKAMIPRDKEVNALNKQFQNELLELMARDASAVRRAMWLTVVCKSLERIADHAKNIAEDVVYLCEAHDIRHQPK